MWDRTLGKVRHHPTTRSAWITAGPTACKESGLGLYDYGARYYDPVLGRFIQADTIIPEPGNPQALNRYSYVAGNPLRYTDPSGHAIHLAVTALVGGLVVGGIGAGAYFASVPQGQRTVGGAALVIGTMALAGALIGTGVGAAAGAEMASTALMSLPAAMAHAQIGAGLALGGLGNLTAEGGADFNSTSYAIDYVGGGAAAAVSAAAPGVGFWPAVGRAGGSGGIAYVQSLAKDQWAYGVEPDFDAALATGFATMTTDFCYDFGTQAFSGVPAHRLSPRNGFVHTAPPQHRPDVQLRFSQDPYGALMEQTLDAGRGLFREYFYQSTRDYVAR